MDILDLIDPGCVTQDIIRGGLDGGKLALQERGIIYDGLDGGICEIIRGG